MKTLIIDELEKHLRNTLDYSQLPGDSRNGPLGSFAVFCAPPCTALLEIKRTCQEPLGERQKCVAYKIACACQNTVCVGETWRLFQTRKKEHMDKVRLTNGDLHKGNTLSAEKRKGKEEGGLARHTIVCQNEVDWGNAEIVARERKLKQRKVLEGIESLRQRHCGMRVLNNFDYVETWKPILKSFFDLEKDCRRR